MTLPGWRVWIDTGGTRGEIVEVTIRVPRRLELDEEQRELLHRLGELEGRPVREERRVLDRVKDLFGN